MGQVFKSGMEVQETGRLWCGHLDHRAQIQAKAADISKSMHEQEEAYHDVMKLERCAAIDSFSVDEQLRRDDSNLELWASHKEKIWDKDASKQRKEPINRKEIMVKMEEQAKMDEAIIAETKRKLIKEKQKEDDHAADQGVKGVLFVEPVHPTESKPASIDQSRNHQHLETVAKLEKRRERFKQPIAGERNVNKKAEYQTELQKDTTEVKPERPARKRRWGSN